MKPKFIKKFLHLIVSISIFIFTLKAPLIRAAVHIKPENIMINVVTSKFDLSLKSKEKFDIFIELEGTSEKKSFCILGIKIRFFYDTEKLNIESISPGSNFKHSSIKTTQIDGGLEFEYLTPVARFVLSPQEKYNFMELKFTINEDEKSCTDDLDFSAEIFNLNKKDFELESEILTLNFSKEEKEKPEIKKKSEKTESTKTLKPKSEKPKATKKSKTFKSKSTKKPEIKDTNEEKEKFEENDTQNAELVSEIKPKNENQEFKLFLIIILVILTIGTACFFGFKFWKNKRKRQETKTN